MLDLLPDLFDEFAEHLTLLAAPWRQFGAKRIFYGQVVTVSCFEDNSRVKELLATPGMGRVLVVDGGGSQRKALVGDLIAQSALDNGWAGIVVHGAIRDAGTLATLNLGIQALGTVPVKTERRGLGDTGVTLNLVGVTVNPGDWIYADDNGIAISREALPIIEQD
ncbi:putative 4-hydroxy-4-methyl-2-oxoglutarate aldolase [Shewanella litorisediminis]|uniref:4-hydroxy-4-methyl-2-oxoglutarate aldolase n=1 Tax=Shewanella litorisediminis TaxID=1173586 RepID=A0ABX7FYR8_9GAMM|nr:putative 4-hydroxy-4-methyl-2-oxoglutarate aldolase [Shewanella litorisediminis]MCL2918855.1 putative 4-hydroxy-4-methyl-2-oxoglutarate aldolase [Shewanella litorisediminis]QRH00179.1 putative 4-hydroxy-4-methyl-2-oxoglutarate aldolase [Shewanella litorisediminis]